MAAAQREHLLGPLGKRAEFPRRPPKSDRISPAAWITMNLGGACPPYIHRNEDITIFRDKLICGTCIEDLSSSK
jgi:hypothetical protein